MYLDLNETRNIIMIYHPLSRTDTRCLTSSLSSIGSSIIYSNIIFYNRVNKLPSQLNTHLPEPVFPVSHSGLVLWPDNYVSIIPTEAQNGVQPNKDVMINEIEVI